MNTPDPTEDQIVAILTNLATGQLAAETVAASLGLDLDGLEALVTTHPELAEQASQRARELQSDPDETLSVSQQGLHNAATALARRIQENPDSMTVPELVSAGGLLEKLAGIAERRKLELKNEIDPGKEKNTSRVPIYVEDQRPNPATGAKRFVVRLVMPDSPAWVDFTDPQFQAPAFDWLNHFYPLSIETGECLHDQRLELLGPNDRYMDSMGRVFGAHQ